MESKLFQVGGSPSLSILECGGDLRVNGWSKDTIRLQAEEQDLEARQEGDTLMVSCRTDLRLNVPFRTELKAHTLLRDAKIKQLEGMITIDQANGDLVVNKVGPVNIGTVLGDLSIRSVQGDLTVEKVNGDMSVRNIAGDLEIGHVGRDLGARDLHSNAIAREVSGDIRLRSILMNNQVFEFSALGDVIARLPSNTNAEVTLRSQRGDIRLKGQLADQTKTENEITGRMGDGGARLLLEANRDLILISRESDWGQVGLELGELGTDLGDLGAEIGIQFGTEFADLAEEIASQVQVSMEQMSSQLESKLSSLELDREANERAARAAERAAEQARLKMERAADRLRRAAQQEADRARRQASYYSKRTAHTAGRKPSKPAPPEEPVTDDERMAILNMVAEGKISVEEAENLLRALGN